MSRVTAPNAVELTTRPVGGTAPVIAGLTLLAGLAAGAFGGPLAALAGAVFGVAWGLALRWFAVHRAARTDAGRLGTGVLRAALVVAAIQLGGGILHALLSLVAASSEDGTRFLLEPQVGLPLNGFFMVLNSCSEYLLIPSVVLLFWTRPGLRILVVALGGLFLIDRAWTYLYFAPTITQLTGAEVDESVASALAVWATWNFARVVFDVAVVAVLSLLSSKATSRGDSVPLSSRLRARDDRR